MAHTIIFWILAIMSVVCALGVTLHKNPVVSAVFLIGSFFALAGLYVELHAPFLAAIQIIVYVGAIMVLFVFVMMLLNLGRDPDRFSKETKPRFPKYLALFLLVGLLISFIHLSSFSRALPEAFHGFSIENIATLLFSKYLFPFELLSLLLLIAMVGGVILAKKK